MVAIIDYGAGNIKSVQNALERLGCKYMLTNEPEKLQSAERIIFPGVGEASFAMRQLKDKNLDKIIPQLKQPVLGICLGMQLLCSKTEEGNTQGLGIFEEEVKKFPKGKKVPHMGWNNISELKGPLFNNIPENSDVYFVHGYFAEYGSNTISECHYGFPFSAALAKNNFQAVQFHPEKSGDIGEMILGNFMGMTNDPDSYRETNDK